MNSLRVCYFTSRFVSHDVAQCLFLECVVGHLACLWCLPWLWWFKTNKHATVCRKILLFFFSETDKEGLELYNTLTQAVQNILFRSYYFCSRQSICCKYCIIEVNIAWSLRNQLSDCDDNVFFRVFVIWHINRDSYLVSKLVTTMHQNLKRYHA